ncbi:pentapeptide repeat-containing protein [Bacterioplanoides sp.]|uniref:pentapeptide repeat-containing protein n=1 Tax=Bacterioplanoides sp. TaxID=2066072 RepID=UPI003AFF9925
MTTSETESISSDSPTISQDPLYQMLRHDNVEGFNQARADGQTCDLRNCDLRGLDLRNLKLLGMDLTNAYFRGADLRGIDFRGCCLDGASLADAKISGCYFPVELSAQEIQLSVSLGTRLRHNCG